MRSTRVTSSAHLRPYLAGCLGGLGGAVVMGLVALALARAISGITGRMQPNVLLEIAGLVNSSSPALGFLLHLLIGAAIGISFAVLVSRQTTTTGTVVGWAILYGTAWTAIGTLTMMPLLHGAGLDGVRKAFGSAMSLSILPSLVGHAVFGAVLGLIYLRFSSQRNQSS